MDSSKAILQIFIHICVMLILYGCNVPENRSSIDTKSTITVETTETNTSTYTQSPEDVSPEPTAILPTTLTSTIEAKISPTIESTWTAVPTLSKEDALMNLLELFSTNGGCDFPCWWGIRPGDSIQKAIDLSSVLGKAPRDSGIYYSYGLSLDDLNFSDLSMAFYYADNDTVRRIEIALEYPGRLTDYEEVFQTRFSLKSILSRYGTPSDIMVQVVPRAEIDAPIAYTVTIIYELKGFGIEYSGIVDSENPIQMCLKLNDFHLQGISLYSHDSQRMRLLRNRLSAQGHKSIETVTSMRLDQFSQIYSQGENMCIESKIDYRDW